jgi:transcription elongation factor
MDGEGVSAAVERLLAEIAIVDRQLTEDLIYALHTYISAETRLIALDNNVGKDVEHPRERLARLEVVLARLELELGI